MEQAPLNAETRLSQFCSITANSKWSLEKGSGRLKVEQMTVIDRVFYSRADITLLCQQLRETFNTLTVANFKDPHIAKLLNNIHKCTIPTLLLQYPSQREGLDQISSALDKFDQTYHIEEAVRRQEATDRLKKALDDHYGYLPKGPGDEAINNAIIADLVSKTSIANLSQLTLDSVLDELELMRAPS